MVKLPQIYVLVAVDVFFVEFRTLLIFFPLRNISTLESKLIFITFGLFANFLCDFLCMLPHLIVIVIYIHI